MRTELNWIELNWIEIICNIFLSYFNIPFSLFFTRLFPFFFLSPPFHSLLFFLLLFTPLVPLHHALTKLSFLPIPPRLAQHASFSDADICAMSYHQCVLKGFCLRPSRRHVSCQHVSSATSSCKSCWFRRKECRFSVGSC